MHTPLGRDASSASAAWEDATGDARWRQLIEDLKSKLPQMQEQFLTLVRQIPEYSGSTVSGQDLQGAANDSIALILEALADKENYPRLLAFATGLGELRARQGLPSQALISAVTPDFPTIWSTLTEAANSDDAALLVNRAQAVWRVVDDYAAAVQSSYLAARVNMAQEEAGVRQEFVSALFGAQGRLPEIRARFANAFKLDGDAAYGIAVAKGPMAAKLRQLAALPNRSTSLFLHQSEDYINVFWPESRGPERIGQIRVPAGLSSIRCGLSRAEGGLIDLAAAGRIAAALFEVGAKDDGGPVTMERHWPRLARTRMEGLGVGLGDGLEADLARGRPDEVDRLRETVVCFLQNGSVSATAKTLYCHRNTILNRMRRFKELTGIDLMVPAQSARALIAWA